MLKSFVGSTSVSVRFDPAEYRGMPMMRITEEIKKTLKEIAPDVDFFENEIVEAANELASGH